MDKIIWLIEQPIFLIIIVVGILFIIPLYIIAFRQGREISIGPLKIGAKPTSQKQNKEIAIGIPEQDKDSKLDRTELLHRMSELRTKLLDSEAKKRFLERLFDKHTEIIIGNELSKIENLFAKRDLSVKNGDKTNFLDTQFMSKEIAGGASNGYLACSSMKSSILYAVKGKHPDKGTPELYVLLKEEYEKGFKTSHSSYLHYTLINVNEDIKIHSLKSI